VGQDGILRRVGNPPACSSGCRPVGMALRATEMDENQHRPIAQSAAGCHPAPVFSTVPHNPPQRHPVLRGSIRATDRGGRRKSDAAKGVSCGHRPGVSQRVLGMSFRKARARSGTATRWTRLVRAIADDADAGRGGVVAQEVQVKRRFIGGEEDWLAVVAR